MGSLRFPTRCAPPGRRGESQQRHKIAKTIHNRLCAHERRFRWASAATVTLFLVNGLLLLPASVCLGATIGVFRGDRQLFVVVFGMFVAALTGMLAFAITANTVPARAFRWLACGLQVGLLTWAGFFSTQQLLAGDAGDGYALAVIAAIAVLNMLCMATLMRFRPLPNHLCPECAYDLRGNLESGCPECGWRREPLADAAPDERAVD